MAFNILSGTISAYDLVASGTFSGSYVGDGSELINVKQFDVQNQGDQRLLFYKLVNGAYQLNANSGLTFNSSTNALLISGPKVGIGTTSPSRPLNIVAPDNEIIRIENTQAGGDCVINYRTSYGTDVNWAGGIKGSDDSFRIANSTNVGTTDRLTINSNGYIGIGTTSPDALLDIKGNGSADNEVLRFGLDGDRDWSFAQEGTGVATGLRLRSLAAKDFYLDATAVVFRNHDGSAEIMRVEPANSKVGIGTATPSAKLDVVGNLKVSTALTASTAKLTGLALGTAAAASYLALDSSNNIVLTSSAGGSGGGGGGISYSRRFISTHATASTSDTLIGISASAPLELRLPSAGGYDAGQYFVVKDEGGNCNTHNITILASGSQTIDGVSSIILESPYAAVSIYSDGTSKYFIY